MYLNSFWSSNSRRCLLRWLLGKNFFAEIVVVCNKTLRLIFCIERPQGFVKFLHDILSACVEVALVLVWVKYKALEIGLFPVARYSFICEVSTLEALIYLIQGLGSAVAWHWMSWCRFVPINWLRARSFSRCLENLIEAISNGLSILVRHDRKLLWLILLWFSLERVQDIIFIE